MAHKSKIKVKTHSPAKPKVSKRLAGQHTVKKGKGEGVTGRISNTPSQRVKKGRQ